MTLGNQGNGIVLHAVVQLCRFRFEVGGDEPVGGALHFCGAAGNPKFDADKAQGGRSEQKERKELQMIADHGEVGADACWIHGRFSPCLTCESCYDVGCNSRDLARVMFELYVGYRPHAI